MFGNAPATALGRWGPRGELCDARLEIAFERHIGTQGFEHPVRGLRALQETDLPA